MEIEQEEFHSDGAEPTCYIHHLINRWFPVQVDVCSRRPGCRQSTDTILTRLRAVKLTNVSSQVQCLQKHKIGEDLPFIATYYKSSCTLFRITLSKTPIKITEGIIPDLHDIRA